MKIAVLGSGAWGTALASRLAGNPEHDVVLWGRDNAIMAQISATQRNEPYLPNIELSKRLRTSARFADAVDARELIILGGPVAATRELIWQISPSSQATVLSLSKGFVADEADAQRTQLLPEVMQAATLGAGMAANTGLLSGPSFAGETARGLPLALVCALPNLDEAQHLAKALKDPAMRIYASNDLIGVAVCGAVKNVFAIAAGISDGFALGANARAALVTRGLAELRRLVAACGGNVDTVSGLAGVGDVLLTTTGDASRNRRVGLELAAGKSLAEVLVNLGHVAEGVTAARLTRNLAAQHSVEMPISSAVAALIEGSVTPKTAIEALLTRKSRAEF